MPNSKGKAVKVMRPRQNARKQQGPTRRSVVTGLGDVIRKSMTLYSGLISATAGGVITTAPLVSSTVVQTNPATEWASFAARYQQYRVMRCKVHYTPVSKVNIAGVQNGRIFVSDYIGSATPASVAQVLSDERCQIKEAMSSWTYEADWSRNPNAKLWNPTSAAVPVANVFGIAWGANADFTANQALGFLVYEWDVEFRGSQ